jgi:tetratricopeptide (TPR) repeat protein
MLNWIEKTFSINREKLEQLTGRDFINLLRDSSPPDWASVKLPDDFLIKPDEREVVLKFLSCIFEFALPDFVELFYNKVLEKKDNNPADLQRVYIARGKFYAMQHRFSDSIKDFEKALELASNPESSESRDQVMNYLGVVYYRMGELQKALEAHEKSLEILSINENEERKAIYFNNLGIVQKEIGLTKEAADSFKRALPILKKLDRPEFLAILYGNIGTVYNQLDRHKEALDFQNEALKLHRQTGNKLEECRVLGNIGNILREMGEYADAARTIKEALNIARENGYKLLQGINLYNLGLLYKITGNSSDAETSFINSAEISESIDDKEGVWRAFSELGNLNQQKGNIDASYKHYRHAESVFESMRRDFKSDRNRVAFIANQKELMEKLVFLELERNTENFWGQMQDGKSKALRELLIEDTTSSESDSEWSEEKANALWCSELLSGSDAIIDFFVGEDALIRLVYSPMFGLKRTVKKISRKKIAAEVQRIYEEIKLLESLGSSITPSHHAFASEGEWLKPYENLHFLLFDDISHELRPFDQLIINPHGILHRLPFAALRNSFGPLITDHSVVISPSLPLLSHYLHHQVDFEDGLKVFVTSPDDNAAMTRDEGRQLSEISGNGILVELSDQLEVYVPSGFRGELEDILSLGKKSGFKRNLSKIFGEISLFHFAGHGHFDESEPMNSYLKLSSEKRITSEEFYQGVFRSNKMKLIALSACETGKVRVDKGDELWGFTRALFGSGARSLLLSLWKLEDKISYDLMLEFYRNMFHEDLPIGRSLGVAQRSILDRMGDAHPFFWAPFNLYGSPY